MGSMVDLDINGFSQGFCKFCNKNLINAQLSYLLSPDTRLWCECGAGVTLDNVRFVLSSESKERADPLSAKTFNWFHGTTVENWFEKIVSQNAYVHVGEFSASMDILSSALHSGKNMDKIFLWCLRFTVDADFSFGLHGDENDDELYPKNKASIYMNVHESPGSISIYTPACFLEPVSVSLKCVEDIKNYNSLYSFDDEACLSALL